jgi:hypothetical protein
MKNSLETVFTKISKLFFHGGALFLQIFFFFFLPSVQLFKLGLDDIMDVDAVQSRVVLPVPACSHEIDVEDGLVDAFKGSAFDLHHFLLELLHYPFVAFLCGEDLRLAFYLAYVFLYLFEAENYAGDQHYR